MKKPKSFAVLNSWGSQLRVCLCLLAVSTAATALPAFAQISIGPNLTPGRITYEYGVSQDPFDPGEPAWLFGNSYNPVSISFNSAAGVWQQRVSGDGSFSHNQEVDLIDYVKIGNGSPWIDWHETIDTPNFVWSTDADDAYYTINGGAPRYSGITYSPDHTSVNITLPTALPVGDQIVLHDEIQYTGSACFNNNSVPIVLNQFVTVPEPVSLAVLGLGAVLALIPRRRKQTILSLALGGAADTPGRWAVSAPKCPPSPSERLGGRRFVCCHPFSSSLQPR